MSPRFWENDVMGSWQIVPDESTRCGCLVLHVTKYVKTELGILCDYLTEIGRKGMITWSATDK